MKISFLTLLLIAALFHTTHAQTSQLRFGARAGGSVSCLTGDVGLQDGKPAPGLGFYAGGLMTIPMAEEWSLQPEVQFVVESGKMIEEVTLTADNGKTSKGDGILRHKVTALRMPILARWSNGSFKAGHVGIVAGPVCNYILSVWSDYSRESVSHTSSDITERDLTSKSQQLQFGITAGVEYYITDDFLVDIRGILSITNHLKEPYSGLLSTLTLGAGYRF